MESSNRAQIAMVPRPYAYIICLKHYSQSYPACCSCHTHHKDAGRKLGRTLNTRGPPGMAGGCMARFHDWHTIGWIQTRWIQATTGHCITRHVSTLGTSTSSSSDKSREWFDLKVQATLPGPHPPAAAALLYSYAPAWLPAAQLLPLLLLLHQYPPHHLLQGPCLCWSSLHVPAWQLQL